MTLHLPSILVGIVAAYAFVVLVEVQQVVENWVRERIRRKAALKRLLAERAVTEVEKND